MTKTNYSYTLVYMDNWKCGRMDTKEEAIKYLKSRTDGENWWKANEHRFFFIKVEEKEA